MLQVGKREVDISALDAVLAVDDSGVELAALLSERLGLPGNPAHAVPNSIMLAPA